MYKFVSILIVVMSLNFMMSYTATDLRQLEEIAVEFSTNAIGIESGQPVFSKDTKVSISTPKTENVKLFINEDKKEMSNGKIELSNLEKGTYTLMIVSEKDSKSEHTVGFTIQ